MWLKALAIELVRVTRSATGSALPLARYFLSEADALLQDTSRLPPFFRALVLQIPTLADVKPGSSMIHCTIRSDFAKRLRPVKVSTIELYTHTNKILFNEIYRYIVRYLKI